MNSHSSISFSVLMPEESPQEQELPPGATEVTHTFHMGEDGRGIDYVAHLLRLGQLLCTLVERHAEFLCQEVKVITQERAYLQFSDQAVFTPDTFSILPLHFNNFKYGFLYVVCDETHRQPAIPLFTAHMMAQTLSYILHMLEQHLLMQSFQKKFYCWTTVSLTKREREVLSLICQGCTQEEMAELLTVSLSTISTHRQHIYEQLGVHNEYDARIAAHSLGLFSFLHPDV